MFLHIENDIHGVNENAESNAEINLLELIENADNENEDPDFIPSESDISEDTKIAGQVLENILMSDCEILDQQDFENEENVNTTNFAKENRKSIKFKRNKGKSYVSSAGKIVKERKVKKLEDCRKKCKDKVSFEQQNKIFDHYWKLGSYNLRLAYASSLINVQNKTFERKQKNELKPRSRTMTNYYFLEFHGIRISVCQKCFRYTLCETEQFIKTVVRKKLEFTGPTDKRGSHPGPRKISAEMENEVIEFIGSFPAYESHYSRRDTSKKYLPSDLSLSLIYKLYTEKFSKVVSISKFSYIFHTLNLSFKKPKIDTCHKCDVFKMKMEIATRDDFLTIKTQHEEHLTEAEDAYTSKRLDKDKSYKNKSLQTFTFDLQQCLPTPFLRSSVSFYKRPLWTFNLTVQNIATGQPVCFMWHEAIANRGGNEIASCIFHHLKMLSPETNHVIFYSDCCVGQNRNSFMVTMFQTFLATESSNIETIDHKFLTPGHTHMECDVTHSIIERRKKNHSKDSSPKRLVPVCSHRGR